MFTFHKPMESNSIVRFDDGNNGLASIGDVDVISNTANLAIKRGFSFSLGGSKVYENNNSNLLFAKQDLDSQLDRVLGNSDKLDIAAAATKNDTPSPISSSHARLDHPGIESLRFINQRISSLFRDKRNTNEVYDDDVCYSTITHAKAPIVNN
ncbi:hypothetical protein WICMUC_000938 [Wickerhamomyces mucosus]|uniref:Uncharacterized protein n=1 Tax=Wickerhamomyces mucosus TaxID=1378264 RepID=A0A9P8PWA5_9ASCO|nr:hypothetical protein WICMUC_000938 [Wickerhamomyces mucosus]